MTLGYLYVIVHSLSTLSAMEDNIYDYSPDLCPESGFSNEVFREDSLQQDSSETLEPNLPNLPLDLLLRIGEYLDPKDVCEGVCQTNRSLNGVFGERSYWHNRLRAECKEYYTFLEGIWAPPPPGHGVYWGVLYFRNRKSWIWSSPTYANQSMGTDQP